MENIDEEQKKFTYNLVFLDTETTGTGEEDRLVQVAYKTKDETVDELFKPELPMKVESMAVCHITNKMLEDKPKFQGSQTHSKLVNLFASDSTVLVAHNAKFDIDMLVREGIEPKNFICTHHISHSIMGNRINIQLQKIP